MKALPFYFSGGAFIFQYSARCIFYKKELYERVPLFFALISPEEDCNCSGAGV